MAVDGPGIAAGATAQSEVSAGPPSDARRPLWLATFPAAWIPIAALTAAFAAGLTVPPAWRYGPLVASAAVLGLPHGAVDWTVLPRAVRGRLDRRWIAVVVGLYLLLGTAYAAAWFVAPVAAAVGFLLLTWFHWGQGDVWPLLAVLGAAHLRGRWRRIATGVVRGGLPMLVPLVGFPERYRAVLAGFAAPFGGDLAAWPVTLRVRLALGVGFAGVCAATLLAGSAAARAPADRRAWAVDAGEVALLWAFFLAVPPVLAVGTYFCCWHALRHVVRAVALDGRSLRALADGRSGTAAWRFAREAALPTLGGLAVCAGLWMVAPAPEPTVAGAVAVYLVAIAALTLPHAVVVTVLDRAQGVWAPSRPG